MPNLLSTSAAATTGERTFPKAVGFTSSANQQRTQARRHTRAQWEGVISLAAVAGDLVMIVLGFVIAFWLRYKSGLISFPSNPSGLAGSQVILSDYWRLILFGSGLICIGMLTKGSYEYRDLLAPEKAMSRFIVILSLGLFAFIGITLAVRTVPPISRLYVVCCWVILFMTLYAWRLLLSTVLRHPALVQRLRKRLVVVGAGPETLRIQEKLRGDYEFEFVGWVQGNKPNRLAALQDTQLGSLHELETIFKTNLVDVAVLAETESLQREGVSYVVKVCEREHIQFRLVPNFLEILISGLSPSVVGGVSVLGVDSLPLNAYQNRALKRLVDIFGAVVGLVISAPLIAIFGALVYLESPGPIFYRQLRSGRHGRLFHILKIRSMKMDAEPDGKAQWAQENDPRRLKIGAFIRRTNLDEIPQFWNVLKGDMSLVGPRPERPELILHFKYSVPHYQTRHMCLPGMSGWAQVNGWRGNTNLEERIRCDIWYVEHWSLLLDLRILLMTFFHQKNAY